MGDTVLSPQDILVRHSSGGGFSRPVFAKTEKESGSATIASIIIYLVIFMFVTYWFLQLWLHASPSFLRI